MRKSVLPVLVAIFILSVFISNAEASVLIWYDSFSRDVFTPWISYGEAMSISSIDGNVRFYWPYSTPIKSGIYRTTPTILTDFIYTFDWINIAGAGPGSSRIIFNDTQNKSLSFEIDRFSNMWRIYYDNILYNSTYFYIDHSVWYNITIKRDSNFVSFSSPGFNLSYNLPIQYPITLVKHHFTALNSNIRIDNSHLSTGITTDCFDISESGYYKLTTDINAYYQPHEDCIKISASNVILDLNKYGIWAGGVNQYGSYGDNYGIFVYNPTKLTNVTIKNGAIVGFGRAGVYLGNTENSTLINLDFVTGNRGIESFLTKNILIKYSNFTNTLTGIYAFNMNKSNIEYNYFRSYNYGIYANTMEFTNISTINMYSYMINTTITPVCFNNSWLSQTCILPILSNETYNVGRTAGTGIYCENCRNNIYSGSLYATNENSMLLSGNSRFNLIGNSISYVPVGQYKGFYLDSSTYNNTGCSLIGYFINYGTNNTYDIVCPSYLAPMPLTPCTPSFICIDSNTRAFVDVYCNMLNYTACEFGCNTTINNCNTYDTLSPFPFIQPSNYLAIISSPMIIWTIILIGSGIYAETKSKNSGGRVFALVLFLGVIILSVFKVYPVWIPILFVLIGGLIAFKLFSGK